MSNLNIGEHIDQKYKDAIVLTIQKYWNSFCKEGARSNILDYELSINTGAFKPVFVVDLHGPHERPIILEQIESLLDNDWIEECGGAWGSMIVLVAQPHQEHINDIKCYMEDVCILSWP